MPEQVLTLAEIEEQYDSEWILIEDPELDDQLRVVRGKVVAHSKDRDEVDSKAIELGLRHSAFLYTGTMPDNMAIIL